MKVVVQRVSRASVKVEHEIIGKIEKGLVLLIGIAAEDTIEDIRYVAQKCVHLRIFEDTQGKMNQSLTDIAGSVLAISQFTLLGDTRKGRRPSFIQAAPPEKSEPLYDLFIRELKSMKVPVECGKFGAMMDVELVNDGPVTLIVESRK